MPKDDEKLITDHNIRLTASEMAFLWAQIENLEKIKR